MSIITLEENPELFRLITDRNLLRQFDYLKDTVEIALQNQHFMVSSDIVRQLNNHATVNLCETPGQYRRHEVQIKNCPHIPPKWHELDNYMEEFFRYLATNWSSRSPTHLAAYALWRINWIHPFAEGNGRTARAMCYLIFCVKFKIWLPGTNTIPKQIRDNRTPYYNGLRDADSNSDDRIGRMDVSKLEEYLEGLLAVQLQS